MIASLLKPLIGPIIKALFGVALKIVKQQMAIRDIEKLRKEKEKLRKIQKELHHKKSFNDEESTKLSSDLADITSRL